MCTRFFSKKQKYIVQEKATGVIDSNGITRTPPKNQPAFTPPNLTKPPENDTETPTPPIVQTPTPPPVETPSSPTVGTPTPSTVETPSPSAVETPTPPAVETPTPPAVETPTPSVVETPTLPAVETPSPPAVETPTPPTVETPTPPTVETPTTVSEEIYTQQPVIKNETTPEQPEILVNGNVVNDDNTDNISRDSTDIELPVEIRIHEERRPGVIPLSVNFDKNDNVERHPKTSEDDNLIRKAIADNDFLNKIIKDSLVKDVVDAMYNREIKANEVIIKEGEKGAHMYVSAQGQFEVSVKGKGAVNTFDDVRIFGEMAILYNDKRNATIKALTNGRVWVLDRTIYQKIMIRINIKEEDEMLAFLQNVKTLNKVGTKVLRKVTSLLKVKYFAPGSIIIKQGEKGDKFYIIRAGTVTITREGEGVVGNYTKGQYFGELALLKEDVRQATVTADATSGVECLTLKRQQFIDHFGELKEDGGLLTVPEPGPKVSVAVREHQDIELEDLNIISTLGIGGFGRVELVKHKNKNFTFALKYLKKIDMVDQNQQDHVYNERNIQMDCRSKFIIRLYRSYKSNKYIYFLMEACLGGDLWTLLQRQKTRRFDEKDARFIAGCVLEAFTYLHERGIVYRDLKPENLLIDSNGYIKLTDFGFAKKLGSRGRTFTFAGTPEYVAPEIILSRGHDKAVDYWAFGIFIYELLTGKTPFRTNDASHMRTYNKILTGIDSVDFPSCVQPKARNIIEKLCRAIPTERLGCQRNGVKDIKDHRWFLGFDWIKLNEGKLHAPFKPKLRSDTDTRYFEAFKKDNDIPPDETSGWDKDF